MDRYICQFSLLYIGEIYWRIEVFCLYISLSSLCISLHFTSLELQLNAIRIRNASISAPFSPKMAWHKHLHFLFIDLVLLSLDSGISFSFVCLIFHISLPINQSRRVWFYVASIDMQRVEHLNTLTRLIFQKRMWCVTYIYVAVDRRAYKYRHTLLVGHYLCLWPLIENENVLRKQASSINSRNKNSRHIIQFSLLQFLAHN